MGQGDRPRRPHLEVVLSELLDESERLWPGLSVGVDELSVLDVLCPGHPRISSRRLQSFEDSVCEEDEPLSVLEGPRPSPVLVGLSVVEVDSWQPRRPPTRPQSLDDSEGCRLLSDLVASGLLSDFVASGFLSDWVASGLLSDFEGDGSLAPEEGPFWLLRAFPPSSFPPALVPVPLLLGSALPSPLPLSPFPPFPPPDNCKYG